MKSIRLILSSLLCILASGSLLAQSAQTPSDESGSVLYALGGSYYDASEKTYSSWDNVPCNVIWEGDSVVWFDNLFPNATFPDGGAVWVKGIVEYSIRITIQPQVVYRMTMDHDGMSMIHEYTVGQLQGTVTAPTGSASYQLVNNPKDHKIEPIQKDAQLALFDAEGNVVSAVKSIGIEEVGDGLVVVPADAEVGTFLMHYTDQATQSTQTTVCRIAIRDNKAWIQGMSHLLPEAWVVGTIMDFGTIELEYGQLLGAYNREAILYFVGAKKAEGTISKLSLAYQAQTGGYLVSPEYMFVETTLSLNAYGGYCDIEMLPSDGTLATPRNPWNLQIGGSVGNNPYIAFQYETESADGKWIVTDSLYYQVYVDDQLQEWHPAQTGLSGCATRIPCTFAYDTYFLQYANPYGGAALPLFLLPYTNDQWHSVGVQLVYACFGQELATDIITLANPEAAIEATQRDIEADAPRYNLFGQRLSGSPRGLVLTPGSRRLYR